MRSSRADCTIFASFVAFGVQRGTLVRVTLIHNPSAGSGRVPDVAGLVDAIEQLGWKVTPLDKKQLDVAVEKPGEAILVAGGDGIVGKVAKRLARTGIPMGVIPTGTANNVARTLGVGVDARAAIDLLERATVREVDLGCVQKEGEEERFLEGFGVGIFAWVMAERATRKKDKKLRRAFGLIAKELERYAPHRARIEIDGRDVSGEYLLLAAMNLRSLGPALGLAPDAHFDDGLLDVVLVHPEHRDALHAHLKRAALEGDLALPRFEVHRGERVRISGHGRWAHVDDCSREFEGDVELGVEPGVVKFLVPPDQPS